MICFYKKKITKIRIAIINKQTAIKKNNQQIKNLINQL